MEQIASAAEKTGPEGRGAVPPPNVELPRVVFIASFGPLTRMNVDTSYNGCVYRRYR